MLNNRKRNNCNIQGNEKDIHQDIVSRYLKILKAITQKISTCRIFQILIYGHVGYEAHKFSN